MSIETLIDRVKTGDRAAFREIYERLADRVFSFVRSRTRTREDALDTLQEIFADFWSGMRGFQFRSEPELYAYIYTVAKRKISRRYRRAREQMFHVEIEDVADVVVDEASHEEKIAALDVKNAIAQLKEKDREIIELRYGAGLSFGEIAALTGKSENALKVRHHRAVEKLKQITRYA